MWAVQFNYSSDFSGWESIGFICLIKVANNSVMYIHTSWVTHWDLFKADPTQVIRIFQSWDNQHRLLHIHLEWANHVQPHHPKFTCNYHIQFKLLQTLKSCDAFGWHGGQGSVHSKRRCYSFFLTLSIAGSKFFLVKK